MKRAAIVFVLAAVLAPAAGAQRASRPADDWMATLEAPERVAGLKIPEVVAAMKLRPGDVVADLGAGSGLFVVPLSSAVGAKGKVLAVEIDRDFFPHIQRKAKAAGVTNVQTIAGEPTDPKLPEAVDVALLHDVLHHVENPAAYIKSLAKYLKPDSTHRHRRLPGEAGAASRRSVAAGWEGRGREAAGGRSASSRWTTSRSFRTSTS